MRPTFSRDITDEVPSLGDLRLVVLQLDHALVSADFEVLFVVKALLGFLVESLEIANRRHHRGVIGKLVFQMGDEHAKLGAPVADVVQSEDVVSKELHQSRYALADDGRSIQENRTFRANMAKTRGTKAVSYLK